MSYLFKGKKHNHIPGSYSTEIRKEAFIEGQKSLQYNYDMSSSCPDKNINFNPHANFFYQITELAATVKNIFSLFENRA